MTKARYQTYRDNRQQIVLGSILKAFEINQQRNDTKQYAKTAKYARKNGYLTGSERME